MRIILIITLLFLVSFSGLNTKAAEELTIESHSAILMEAVTGEIIFVQNAHEPLHPASITKIMTLLLIMEALDREDVNLEDEVVVSQWAARMGGSQIWLEVGEVMTFKDLLKAVAIASANDASVALAEHIYGSEAAFVQAMNERSRELGLRNTVFFNCTGLPGDAEERNNLTSAHDVAVISRELLQYPEVLQWTSIWIDYIRDGQSVLNNTNRLVRHFPGVDGLKTGYTSDAKFCLAATGIRDNIRFIAVVMKSPSSQIRFDETGKLLTHGFGIFRGVPVARQGDIAKMVPIQKGVENQVPGLIAEDLIVPVKRGAKEDFSKTIKWQAGLNAPIREGTTIGEVLVTQNDTILGKVDIIAGKDISRGGFRDLLGQLGKSFFENFYRLANN